MAVHQESGSNTAPVFLRSYASFSDPLPDDLRKIKVWEAARATSAAPGYFAPMKIGRWTFVDGGLMANNPIGWYVFRSIVLTLLPHADGGFNNSGSGPKFSPSTVNCDKQIAF